MNDPEIACYIAVVNPKNTIQYGGVVVAPMVKEALESAFSILRIEKQSGGIPLDARFWIDTRTYVVDDYIGMNIKKLSSLNNGKYNLKVIGNGQSVIAQLPEAGYSITEGGTVILYTD